MSFIFTVQLLIHPLNVFSTSFIFPRLCLFCFTTSFPRFLHIPSINCLYYLEILAKKEDDVL